MKPLNILLQFCLFLFCTGSSCKKTNPPEDVIPIGGRGGNITIVAFPEHHGKPVINLANYPDTAFIKYNTQEYPGSKAAHYDTLIIGETGEDHVHIPGMKRGNYFIYMVGFDTTINERVYGGIPVSYKLFPSDNGEIVIHVPVVE